MYSDHGRTLSPALADTLKATARTVAIATGLTPMHRVFARLERLGMTPGSWDALEAFGCDGEHHTRVLAATVKTLQIWEHDPRYEAILKRRFPRAAVSIGDSYLEITRTPARFDLVVMDNSVDVGGPHYEHFDMFPGVFRVLENPAVIVVNLLPVLQSDDANWLRRREVFYDAADPAHLSEAEIGRAYRALADVNGWVVEHLFTERRWQFQWNAPAVLYGVMTLRRK